jgi:hypothetical protein
MYVIQPRRPSSGLGALVTGAILLPLGLIFVAISIPLWNAGCSGAHACLNDSLFHQDDFNNAAGALVLDVIGIPFMIAGMILIPIGAARYARWRRMRAQQGMALYDGHGVTVAPSLASGSFGLKLSF